MRMTALLGNTQREVRADIQARGYELLLRAGLAQEHGRGALSYLPLGYRALDKIAGVVRQAFLEVGSQEMRLPPPQETRALAAHSHGPAGREEYSYCPGLVALTEVAARQVRSHRQLPVSVFTIWPFWEPHAYARRRVMPLRATTLYVGYFLDADKEAMHHRRQALGEMARYILHSCDLEAREAFVTNAVGGWAGHRMLVVPHSEGREALLVCERCGYAARKDVAQFAKPAASSEPMEPLQKVETPHASTIEELTALLGIPPRRTAKALFLVGQMPGDVQRVERFVFAVVRGDMNLSEEKLCHVLGLSDLRPATEGEIRAIGAEPGYGSPVGVADSALIVVDEAVARSPNLVAGANEPGYHLLNVNVGRDFTPDLICDIARAEAGDPCSICGSPLSQVPASWVGDIVEIGELGGETLQPVLVEDRGQFRPAWLTVLSISLEHLLSCVTAVHHDGQGLLWPKSIAPYQVHLVTLGPEGSEARRVADELYHDLWEAGVEVLYDDRDRSPGVKFNDADLIGLPVRVTVARRGLSQGAVELKLRQEDQRRLVSLERLVEAVRETLGTG